MPPGTLDQNAGNPTASAENDGGGGGGSASTEPPNWMDPKSPPSNDVLRLLGYSQMAATPSEAALFMKNAQDLYVSESRVDLKRHQQAISEDRQSSVSGFISTTWGQVIDYKIEFGINSIDPTIPIQRRDQYASYVAATLGVEKAREAYSIGDPGLAPPDMRAEATTEINNLAMCGVLLVGEVAIDIYEAYQLQRIIQTQSAQFQYLQSLGQSRIITPSQRLPNLEILNPSYTPNGSRVLQNLTNQVNQELSGNLPLALTVLSDAEIEAAASSSGLARAQYGNALERLVARRIKADPILNDLYKHVGGPSNPDFVGKGMLKGMNFDITTPAQIDIHLARPGYGSGLKVITYERPAGFP